MKIKMSIFGVGLKIIFYSDLIAIVMWVITYIGPSWLSIQKPYSDLMIYIIILIGIILLIELISGYFIILSLHEERLMTRGAYAICRNPNYAYAIIAFPLLNALVTRSWLILVLGPIAQYIVSRILILKEEEILEANYGQEYLEYKRRVNAIFPSIPFRRLLKYSSKKNK